MSKKKKSLRTKQILCTIMDAMREEGHYWADFFVGTMDIRYQRTFFAGGVAAVHHRLQFEEAWRRNQLLRKLQQQKLLRVQQTSDRIILTLTEKGKRVVVREKIRTAPTCKANECVIVVFDIPERAKETRRQFRFFLKECGFRQLQRSVWTSRCDVLDSLQEFIRSTDSGEWIRAFRAFDV